MSVNAKKKRCSNTQRVFLLVVGATFSMHDRYSIPIFFVVRILLRYTNTSNAIGYRYITQ